MQTSCALLEVLPNGEDFVDICELPQILVVVSFDRLLVTIRNADLQIVHIYSTLRTLPVPNCSNFTVADVAGACAGSHTGKKPGEVKEKLAVMLQDDF